MERDRPSGGAYLTAVIGMFLSGIAGLGVGVYNRFQNPTWALDIEAGILVAVAIVCYMYKRDFEQSRSQRDR
jgi:hypothetical protein